jgi:hypothetical protein
MHHGFSQPEQESRLFEAPMATQQTHDKFIHMYLLLMLVKNTFARYESFVEACQHFNVDVQFILVLSTTCYLNGRHHRVPKASQLHLAWKYASNPADHAHFPGMLRVSPYVFHTILSLIKYHPIFTNTSNVPQAPVEVQLAIMLYCFGCYGSGASLEDIARVAGCCEGSVENYTHHCFAAIESL